MKGGLKCWNLFCQGSFYVEADYDEYSPGKDGWNFEFLDGSYVISVKSEKSEENEKKIKIIFETDYWKLGRVKYKDMYKNFTENYDI